MIKKKKIKEVIILFVLMTLALSFYSELVSATDMTLLFSDNFNRNNNSTVGNGWNETEASSTYAEINNNRLLIYDNNPGAGSVVWRYFNFNQQLLFINFRFMISDISKEGRVDVYTGNFTHNDVLTLIRFNSNYIRGVNNADTDYILVSNPTSNVWYTVNITLNQVNKTYNVTVKNENTNASTNINMLEFRNKTGNFTYFALSSGGTASGGFTYLVDDIMILTPSVTTNLTINVLDTYESLPVVGANVTLWKKEGNATTVFSELTSSSGAVTFNVTGNYSFNITHPLYFDFIGVNNISNNTIHYFNLTGAHVNFNFTNLKKEYLDNFSLSSGSQFNSSGFNKNIRLVLKPNATNQVIFNKTGYKPLLFSINTTAKDLRSITINDTYHALLNVNLSFFGQAVNGFKITLYGDGYNSTNYTTGNNLTFPVMLGDISLFVEPDNYSNAYFNTTLYGDANLTISVYSLNSIYFNIINERNKQKINNASLELISNTFSINSSTTDGLINFSLLSPNTYTVRYSSPGFTNREYFLKLNNKETHNINLYLLETNEAVLLVVRVVDTSGNAISGAEVQLRRYFVSNNNYEVVAMCRSSYDGLCYFDVHELVGFYKIAATYGQRSFITTTPEKFVYTGSTIKKDIVLNMGELFYQSYQALPEITRTLTYNNATNTFSFSWLDPTGIVYKGCLILEYPNGTKWSSIETCQNTGNGNVLLTINENLTHRYKAVLYTSTNYSNLIVFSGFINSNFKGLSFGKTGILFGGGVILTLTVAGAFISAAASLIALIIGLLFITFTGLMPFSYAAIASFTAVVLGAVVYLMRR